MLLSDVSTWLAARRGDGRSKPKESMRYFVLDDCRTFDGVLDLWAEANGLTLSDDVLVSLHGYHLREVKDFRTSGLKVKLLSYFGRGEIGVMNGDKKIGDVRYEHVDAKCHVMILPDLRSIDF